MKKTILILLGIIFMLSLTIPANAQEKMEDMEEELTLRGGAVVSYDCEYYENANYYLRYVYLYTVDQTIVGRVKISAQRRDGQFEKLRVEFLTKNYDWELLTSHLYVSTRNPYFRMWQWWRYPHQQYTLSGSKEHVYTLDLEDIGASFENLYIATHAVVKKADAEVSQNDLNLVIGSNANEAGDALNIAPGKELDIPECYCGKIRTAWGYKIRYYPVMDKCDKVNPEGNPWGTILHWSHREWPAYFMIYLPYNVANPKFDCPQPLQLIYQL